MPEHCPAQIKQDVMKALLLRALGGQLQDLGVAAKQLAGVARSRGSLHLISGQHPHLHASFVEGLDGVCCFLLQPVVEEKQWSKEGLLLFSNYRNTNCNS